MTNTKRKDERDFDSKTAPTVVRQKVFSFPDKSSSDDSKSSNQWSFKLNKKEEKTVPGTEDLKKDNGLSDKTYTVFQKKTLKTSMIQLDFTNLPDKKDRSDDKNDFSDQELSLESLETSPPKHGHKINLRRMPVHNQKYQDSTSFNENTRYNQSTSSISTSSLEFPSVSSELRLLAALIDYGIYFLFFLMLYPIVISLQQNEKWDPNNTILQQFALGLAAYFVYLVISFIFFNNTLGKKICGLQVKTDLGLSVDFIYYVVREIFARFLLPMPFFSFIWMIVSDKTLHDLLLKTRVVDRKYINRQ